jgi:hypothetical protein
MCAAHVKISCTHYFFFLRILIVNLPNDHLVTSDISKYSALPDVYGQLHLIPNTQNMSLKSWWVGKIIEHDFFKRMIITK